MTIKPQKRYNFDMFALRRNPQFEKILCFFNSYL